ncbi:MAG: ComF family protein [Candidatus Dormibacteraeota bacterium]|uniref:ComF family protein n=1 Tax=Candidatus Dormiibacter inghamiae TaxID=3127013 RepID=A0A934KGI8_9BACT|nr:ComF family protein [Candidatus Dormibacteraeota bacterium]MBJ7605347.1 ComF family protein [Candidatus Dormibacteraeota bacterium]
MAGWNRLLDWLLPPRCGGCGAVGAWLCAGCRDRVRRLEEPLCRRCGRELEHAGISCGCRARLRCLSRLRSVAAYEGPLERAIHRFKYAGWQALAPALAGLLTEVVSVEVGVHTDAQLVPVPLHPRRLRQRGYNQAVLLVGDLRHRLRLQKPAGRLIRVRDTPPQVGLDRLRRRSNVDDAFEWRGPPLAGGAILLVDDVATTGATLESCAAALKAGGAGQVVAVTLARVDV